MIRKILTVLSLIVAGIGLLICLGGLIGVWVLNTPVTDAITSTLETTASYLALADHTTQLAGDEVDAITAQMEEVANTVAELTPEERAELGASVSNTVKHQFGPAVLAMRTTFRTLRAGVIALNRSLVSANRIPGVNVPTLTDELQVIDRRLTEIGDGLAAMALSITDLSVDGEEVAALAGSVTSSVESLGNFLDKWNAEIEAVEVAITAAGAAVPGVVDWISIVLSLLLVLFGSGQVCLLVRGMESIRS